MLKAQKRHQAPCSRPEWDQRSCAGRGAKLSGSYHRFFERERIRLSTARFLPPDKARDMEAARDLAILWAKVGTPLRPSEYAEPASTAADPGPSRPAVEGVVSAYMADSRDRGNGEASLYKKATVFERTEIVNPRARSAPGAGSKSLRKTERERRNESGIVHRAHLP
jgi:hypothetical protein